MKWNKDTYKRLIEDYADYLLKNKYKIAMEMSNKNNKDVAYGIESLDGKLRIKTEIYKTGKFYKGDSNE